MNKKIERLFRITAATCFLAAGTGCRYVLPDINIANPTPISSPPPDIFSSPAPTPSRTPEPSPTPIPTPVPYELPGGIRLDNQAFPVTMTITLPDNKIISSHFTFRTDKTGATLSTLCHPGDNSVCTYYAPNEKRSFLRPHSGYDLLGRPLEAEAIREYVEGTLIYPNSPDVVAQRLTSLTGAFISFSSEGHLYGGFITFAVRIPPKNLLDYTQNFVIAQEKAAEIFKNDPGLVAEILAPQTLILETCGRKLPGETIPKGSHGYDSSRLLFGIK